ncbi:MAG TPA: hypothetical protein DCG30_07760 [Ruminococcus sp.]|nr:hypothetical protein [Ruminococcus sp.]
MPITEYVLCALLCLVCMICAYTDIKYGKIKNIITIPSALFAFTVNFICQKNNGTLRIYLLNLAVIIAFSMILYFLHFWSAGDSKLLIFVICALPVKIYADMLRGYFSSFALVMVIFSVSFLYLFFESIVLRIRKTDYLRPENGKFLFFIISCLRGFSCITTCNTVFFTFMRDFYIQNQYLFMMLNFFVVIFISRLKIFSKLKYVIGFFVFSILTAVCTDYGERLLHADYRIFLLFFVLLLMRNFMNRYNYKKINVSDLREGMIVSLNSLVSVTDLKNKMPEKYDEPCSSRLTAEECEYIQNIAKTKNTDSLYVLRGIPFGVLISVSAILFTVFGEIYVNTKL